MVTTDEHAMKPLFLIDVDGVVNAWPRVPDEAYHYIQSFGMRVGIHSATQEALRAVLGLANEILWLSAWREKANHEINTYLSVEIDGWPISLGVITDEEDGLIQDRDFSTEWKLKAMQKDERVTKAMAEDRQVVWIEDFGFDYGAYGAAYRRQVLETGVTTIDTTRRGYLTTGDLLQAGLLSRTPAEWVDEAASGPLEIQAIVTKDGWHQ